jgi:hypothetical protein
MHLLPFLNFVSPPFGNCSSWVVTWCIRFWFTTLTYFELNLFLKHIFPNY